MKIKRFFGENFSSNFLELKYISGMLPQTSLKRQAEDVSFHNGMYIVQSEKR